MDDEAGVARTAAISDAIALLGEVRITQFLRAILGQCDVLAIELCNEQLDAGETINQIFLPDPGATSKQGFFLDTGEFVPCPEIDHFSGGYELRAERLGADQFHITFGYVAGPCAGDGGQWEVSFDPDGTFVAAQGIRYWIS